MHRHVGTKIFHHPGGHLVDLALAVILAGDDEIGDLEPDIGLVLQILQGVEHRGELAFGDVAIEAFGKGLQVHIGGVDLLEETGAGPVGDISRRHRHGLDPDRAAGIGDIGGIFVKDNGVVIGEGDRGTAQPLGRAGDRLGLSLGLHRVHLAAFRDVVVLTEITREVAARRPEGQHRGAGQKMVERLLLDRIDTETRGPAISGQHDRVILARPHETQPARALLQLAKAGAHLALHAPILEHRPMLGRHDRPLAGNRRRGGVGEGGGVRGGFGHGSGVSRGFVACQVMIVHIHVSRHHIRARPRAPHGRRLVSRRG